MNASSVGENVDLLHMVSWSREQKIVSSNLSRMQGFQDIANLFICNLMRIITACVLSEKNVKDIVLKYIHMLHTHICTLLHT
jgi:hypothetical protein